ncbi:SDR family oxidoreductase [Sulfidibacter corallicola]|uniref:SDR family oxidoreductase n=1 Tax=Sulfidibacter corallicola TaxID=2818388 RepID=A0A8A4U1A2_SULCO|nr:SDR family oxidoreductase [Sulfidibacter corallicola]QTD52525.1 SDR family oxidoreductase [Sulfidibacter corallicola]
METRWVVVTGAGTGIGRATAIRLSQEGYGLFLLGRRTEVLAETADMLEEGTPIHVLGVDVGDPEALASALASTDVTELYGVVSNAGVGGENHYGGNDRWDEILRINLTGTYHLVNLCLPLLRAGRCDGDDYRRIVLISSILARLGVPGYTAYCASKAGMLGLMRSWASALAPERILVNAVCPGWVDTAMARQGLQTFAESTGKTFEDTLAEQMQSVPLGKMSETGEIASLIAWLFDPSQTSMTGQTVDINNGAMMP